MAKAKGPAASAKTRTSTKRIAAALARIERRDGRIDPHAVVAAARDPVSVLHPLFVWDDTKAAELYRLDQARTIIRRVTVIVEVEERTIKIPRYVPDDSVRPEAGYRNVTNRSFDDDSKRTTVINEFASASHHLRRARDIAAALGLADEVDDLIRRIAGVDAAVRTAFQSKGSDARN